MNADRRKTIAKAAALMSEAKSMLETVRDEEQEYYDNMPEGLQNGDKGCAAEEAISLIEDIINSLDDAESSLEGIIQ